MDSRQDPPTASILSSLRDAPAVLADARKLLDGQTPVEVSGTLFGLIPFRLVIKVKP